MRHNRPPPGGQIDVARLAAAFNRLPGPVQIVIVLLVLAGLLVAGAFYLRDGQAGPVISGPATSGPVTDGPVTGGPARPPDPPPGPVSAPATTADTPHLLLGNPGNATADPARRDNFLVVRPAYALSFNNILGTANWVSWRIVRADFGQSPREAEFLPDPHLPPAFKEIGHRDYTGSGFDRGHLCPKGDRGGDRAQAASTFYTSNIIPQAANVNQKAWNHLENYTRDLVGQHRQRVWVIAGPIGQGGTGLNGTRQTIGHGKVVVPAECWKVIVAIPDTGKPQDDPSAITPAARVIAVVMPNDQTKVGDDWARFRTTPAAIEAKTKLRFFDRLKPDVAEALRQKLDTQTVPPIDPNRYRSAD